MSAYAEVSVKFKDQGCLIEALEAIGFAIPGSVKDGTILVAEAGQKIDLYGYGGDNRTHAKGKGFAAPCDIVIPGSGRPGCKNVVGGASNDIGFRKEGDSYAAVISDYDSSRYNAAWMDKLKAEYGVALVKKNAKANGYTVNTVVKEGKSVMTLSRYRT